MLSLVECLGDTVVSKHLLAEGKNFLHGGGGAEPNSPTVAERLRKLFIFL